MCYIVLINNIGQLLTDIMSHSTAEIDYHGKEKNLILRRLKLHVFSAIVRIHVQKSTSISGSVLLEFYYSNRYKILPHLPKL